MKKVLFSIFALWGVLSFSSCSNGEYIANPTTNANVSANPLNPYSTDAFSWTGSNAVSAKINGTYFHADSTQAVWALDSGSNVIAAYTGLSYGIYLKLKDVYKGGIYSMGFNKTDRMGVWYDTSGTGTHKYKAFFSNFGNDGQVKIIQNDSNRIVGQFYFQALDSIGGFVVNVTEGWFNIKKHP